jgi:cytochrome P450
MARLRDLPYLDQVLNETLRLYPPIHLGSRITAQDVEFKGFQIPRGRRVLYSIFLTHRDPRFWQEPSAFKPERFCKGSNKERPPYVFLPFGGGPRNCIGMAFAQVEARLILTRILQRYRLHSSGQRVHPHMGATLEPRPGVLLRLEPRA